MPPHTYWPTVVSRALYALTIVAVASVIAAVGSAVADRPDGQCRGNAPKNLCPVLIPAPGTTVSGTTVVVAETQQLVAGIEFKVDDVLLAPAITSPPYEFHWDTRRVADGAHVLSATARDAGGNVATSEGVITVANAPNDKAAPTVAFSAPAAGATLTGTTVVSADASDNVGIVGVPFRVDGAPIESEDTTAPYSVSWNTATTTNASHTLTAIARDAAGNTVTAQRSIIVSNQATTPPPPDAPTPSGTFVSSLGWTSATNGWGPVEKDRSNGEQGATDGGTIRLNGVSYARGLGVHALSDVRFSVSCTRFKADVGVDDEVQGTLGTIVFEVYAGSSKVYDSGVMNGTSATKQIDVSIAGASELRLVVTSAGDGVSYDHGSWANARVEGCASAPPPPPPPAPPPPPPPPPPPTETSGLFLSDLTPTSSTNGWGPVEKDRSNGEQGANDGGTIRLNGVSYGKGLGVHAASDVRFALSNCSRFKADIGVDDEVQSSVASIVFEVFADSTKVYDSGVMRASTETKQVDVSIVGVSQLRLVVTGAGDGVGHDHGDWASARIVCGADTSPPTLQLLSPVAGEPVTGMTVVAASASDNVAIGGVQFRINGVNLQAEDTTAPFLVDWNSTTTPNGSHTVTAVARDAAGNTATVSRTVTVSNTSSESGLSWAPPSLSNPVVINVSNANRRLYLDNARDYRLNIVEPLKRELWIEGGRHIVVVGGHITIDQLGGESSYQDNTAVKVRFGNPTGTVHLEGLLIDGPYLNDAIAIATGRNVQIQNVRIERVYDNIKGGHADCVQIQQGVAHLRIDGLTCTTQRQGIFLGDHSGPIQGADLRRVNMYAAGGQHLLWQTTPTYPVSLGNVWLGIAPGSSQWAPFGYWAYPQEDGRVYDGSYDMTRRAQVSSDGSYMVWVGLSNTITGRAYKGVPPAGDFVRRSSVGQSYASPGYS